MQKYMLFFAKISRGFCFKYVEGYLINTLQHAATHSPIPQQTSPAFSQKRLLFSQKSPIFSQKSPAFSQKSPIFSLYMINMYIKVISFKYIKGYLFQK